MKILITLAIGFVLFISCRKESELGVSSPAVSAGTLKDATGNCLPINASGVFKFDSSLNPNHYIDVQVNVTAAGTYTIQSDTLNGYFFRATGNFSNTGINTVRLQGSGSPDSSGTNLFSVKYGNSICKITVHVLSAVFIPVNMDYVPETWLSNWTYYFGPRTKDTFRVIVTGTQGLYNVFQSGENLPHSILHRKNGGMYYKLFDESYGFDTRFNAEGLLLDSSKALNTTWVIQLGDNTWFGQPARGKISAKIVNKDITRTYNSTTYSNIIGVSYIYMYDVGFGDTQYYVEYVEYARGVGEVYFVSQIDTNPFPMFYVYSIARAQVF